MVILSHTRYKDGAIDNNLQGNSTQ
jgi:hypothetical protein